MKESYVLEFKQDITNILKTISAFANYNTEHFIKVELDLHKFEETLSV